MLKKLCGLLGDALAKLCWKGCKHLLLRPTAMMMITLLGVVACSDGGHYTDVSSGSPYGGTRPTRVKIGKAYNINGETYMPRFQPNYQEKGVASWYGPGFHGRQTASGERYDQYQMTAAHRTLPLPSIVRVTRLDNGHSVKVRVNDRGPFHDGRIIDLSKAAAQDLKMIGSGTMNVKVEYLHADTMQYITDLGLDIPQEMKVAGAETIPSKPSSFASLFEASAPQQPAKPQATRVAMAATQKIQATELQAEKPTVKLVWAEPVASLQPLKNSAVKTETYMPFKLAEDLPRYPESDPVTEAQISKDQAQFRVQTAAFASRDNAEKHAESLQPIAKPLISEVERDGTTLYRVSLAPVESYDVAMAMLKKTKEMGYRDARLMVE
jgi:rare lipoprotein A